MKIRKQIENIYREVSELSDRDLTLMCLSELKYFQDNNIYNSFRTRLEKIYGPGKVL